MDKKQSMFIVKSEAFSQLKVQRFLHLPNSNNKSVMNGPYFNKMISSSFRCCNKVNVHASMKKKVYEV